MRASATSATRLLLSSALWCGGCTLLGYDFDRYEPASSSIGETAAGAGGVPELTLTADEPSDSEPGDSAPTTDGEAASTLGAGGETPVGAGGAPSGGAGPSVCGAFSCSEQGAECGAVIDGCGEPQACGSCFWWFEECRHNRCEIVE